MNDGDVLILGGEDVRAVLAGHEPEVLAAVRAAGVHIKDLRTEEPDLEDVFVSLTYAAPDAALGLAPAAA